MAQMVSFYRGTKAQYDATTYADAIFFMTDTKEIAVAGVFYGGSGVSNMTYSNGVLTITDIDGNDVTVTIPEATTSSSGLMSADDKAAVDNISDTIAAAIEEALSSISGENAISVSDNTISLTISDSDLLLINDSTGLSATIGLVKVTDGLDENVKEAYELQDKNGDPIGVRIPVYKDSSLESVSYSDQTLTFVYTLADGTEKTVDIDMSEMITETEFENGLEVNDHKLSVKIDSASEEFLTVSTGGVKLSGVQDAIDTAKTEAVTTSEAYTDSALEDVNSSISELQTALTWTIL